MHVYHDIDNNFHQTSIIIETNISPIENVVEIPNVCYYYNLNCTLLTINRTTAHVSNYSNNSLSSIAMESKVVIEKIRLFEEIMIKTQWFLSWFVWVRLRIKMLTLDLVCECICICLIFTLINCNKYTHF